MASLVWLPPHTAGAMDRGQLSVCLSTSDLKPRLDCYDAVARAPDGASNPGKSPGYPNVELLDLKVDREKLLGRGVTTFGRLAIQGQLVFLRIQKTDNTPLEVSLSRLLKDVQRDVRARCAPSCNAFVTGKVVHVSLGIGLAAEDIVIRSTAP